MTHDAPSMATPASLLERLTGPTPGPAWDRFVRLYTPHLDAWVRNLRLQESDAADLVQDVLLALFEALPDFRYDPNLRFRGWLRTVLLNRYRDHCRRRRPAQADAETLAELRSGAEAVDRVLAEAEYRRLLLREALRLIERDFEPATWRAFHETTIGGRPATEVAAELGLSPGTLYNARSRILARLRAELAGLWE